MACNSVVAITVLNGVIRSKPLLTCKERMWEKIISCLFSKLCYALEEGALIKHLYVSGT